MYLIISKSKITGTSIDYVAMSKSEAEKLFNDSVESSKNLGIERTYYIRPLDLSTLDLDNLIEEGE